MCQIAYRTDTNEEIGSMGDIRRLVGPTNISWHTTFVSAEEMPQHRAEAEALPDINCLCWVDLPNTLVHAGFKVWANPDMIPEYYCEALPSHDRQRS